KCRRRRRQCARAWVWHWRRAYARRIELYLGAWPRRRSFMRGTGGASHVHAVVSYCRGLRYVAIFDVAQNRFTISLFGVAIAAAIGVTHDQPFAGVDGGAGLGVRLGAVHEEDGNRRARFAAGETLRGMLLPVGDERQPHYLG